jgi:hypothetical protein
MHLFSSMMTQQNAEQPGARVAGKLRRLVDAVRRRLRRYRQQLQPQKDEAREPKHALDAVGQAGKESFPASDPPSFTPEKST